MNPEDINLELESMCKEIEISTEWMTCFIINMERNFNNSRIQCRQSLSNYGAIGMSETFKKLSARK